MSAKKVSTTIYITAEQHEQLHALNRRTRVPIAEYVREGIEMALDRHRNEIPGEQQGLSIVGGGR